MMRKPWLMMGVALVIFASYGRNIAPAQPPMMIPKIQSLADIDAAGGVTQAWQQSDTWYWLAQP